MIWVSIPAPDRTREVAQYSYDGWLRRAYEESETGMDHPVFEYVRWHHWSAFCMSWVTVAWAMLVGKE